uniref:SEA domain-containing protein n=1 Tax=Timema bartmani TaxID=61472 RepID=A0A7R9F9K2_9NEOP|nr:unnamed protein product [Timema bartmani]
MLSLKLAPSYVKVVVATAFTYFVGLKLVEGNDLVVHFNVHFDPRWLRVQTSDLFTVLSNEIILEEPMYLANLTIDPNSIDVKESSAALTTQQPLSSITAVTLSPPTTVQPVPRRCGPVQLEYCNKLLYNSTSYPNKLGHNNLQEVLDNVIAFRLCESIAEGM